MIIIYITFNRGKEFFNFQSKKISVVVPCIPRDVNKLDRLMKSIQNQTYNPYEIIIAISDFNKDRVKILEDSLRKKYNLPIKIHSTIHKKLPGENRNRGALYSSGDIISFMDADDKMYPQKLEYVNKYFNLYNPKILIHGYSKGYGQYASKKENVFFTNDIYNMIKKKKQSIENPIPKSINKKMHHGHTSIKKRNH